jgi:hypothetical protein
MVVHAGDPSTLEAKTGGSEFEASLDYMTRFYLKNKQTNKKTQQNALRIYKSKRK